MRPVRAGAQLTHFGKCLEQNHRPIYVVSDDEAKPDGRSVKELAGALTRFLTVGVLNTLIGLSVIYLCKWLLEIGDTLSNLIGYAIALTFSFVVNKQWSFRHQGESGPALVKFLLVIAIAYLANLGTVLLLIEGLSVNSYVSQALGIVPYTALSFLGLRYFAFPVKKAGG